MKNFLKLVQDAPVTQCLVKGEPVASKFQGAMDYPVTVNGEEFTFTASAIAHAMIQKLGIKFGQVFRIQKVTTEKGSKFRVWNATGTEAVLEKGEKPASNYNSGNSKQGNAKEYTKYTPEELASITSKWAVNTAAIALSMYQAGGGQVSDADNILKVMARKYYYTAVELEPEFLDDIINRQRGAQDA
jgi:hypothetical protein